MFEVVTILAQAGSGGAGAAKQGPPSGIMIWGLLIMMGVFFFVMFRGNRAQKKKKEAMFDSMKKNDRVMTIGGVIGTIIQVKEHEIVLKVDEASNTKMTFIRRAIQQVLPDDGDLTNADREQR